MGKETDRVKVSRRRKHKFRMRRRARGAFPDWNKAERTADHLKVCSCWMCGNPRRYAKSQQRLSRQERRSRSLFITVDNCSGVLMQRGRPGHHAGQEFILDMVWTWPV